MTTEILTTKLYPPSAHQALVARPRLTERLSMGLACKLTLLAAPAGFGKTTAVSAWLDPHAEAGATYRFVRRPAQLAWVSLDAGDNDPTRFWRYLITALDSLAPGLAETALQQLNVLPVDTLLTRVLNALTTLSADAVLVLDDYHVITTPIIHDAIVFLLDHLPPHLHMVITSRSEPPLPLSRLRVRGQLTELHAADLRFTPDEAATFLQDIMRLPLDADTVAALEARTEGWVAGLQLAALAMRDRRDLAGFLNSFTGSNRLVMDYLVEEVVARQPTHIQQFLLQTSILDRMCGALCDALLLGENGNREPRTENQRTDSPLSALGSEAFSQLMLQDIERRNLFLIALDDERRWYRYHHLFGTVLRERLMRGVSTTDISGLHQRASTWYEQQGLFTEAIHHALAGRDWERAADLMQQYGFPIQLMGQMQTVLGWVTSLPETLLRSRPMLSLLHATTLIFTNQVDAAETRLIDAERGFQSGPLTEGTRPFIGILRNSRAAIASMRGDYEACVILAREALAVLRETDTLIYGGAFSLAADEYMVSGNMDTSNEQGLIAAIRHLRSTDNPIAALRSLIDLARFYKLQGRLHKAFALYQEIIELASGDTSYQVLIDSSSYHFSLGSLLLEWNDLDAATHHLTRGAELADERIVSDGEMTTQGYIALARLKQAHGDWPGAHTALEAADSIAHARKFAPAMFAHIASAQARLALAQGNLLAAQQWADTSDMHPDDNLSFVREVEYLTLARVLVAQKQSGQAFGLLGRMLQQAETGSRTHSMISILIIQTLALHTQGHLSDALAALERALMLAAPEGYMRVFVDEGPTMRELLYQISSRSSQLADYIATLLAAFPAAPDAPATPRLTIAPSPPPTIDALNERELEVLRLIAAGRSNREIADKLVIAISTVKTHINNCYSKLGVHSRTQALACARELGLI